MTKLCYRLIAVLVLAAAAPLAWGQSCSITSDTQPPGVVAGGTHQFTATNCPSATWSVACQGSGCQAGTINSSSGLYSAPAVVHPQNYSRGVQQGPNNDSYNVGIASWAVHPDSAQWVNRVYTNAPTNGSYHNLKIGGPPRFFQNFFNNVINNSTPTQLVHAVLPWCQP